MVVVKGEKIKDFFENGVDELIQRLNWVTDCGPRQILKNAAVRYVRYVGSGIHHDHFYDAVGLSQKGVGTTTQTWTRQEISYGQSN